MYIHAQKLECHRYSHISQEAYAPLPANYERHFLL